MDIKEMLAGDLPIVETPIHYVEDFEGNHIYMKRDDMIPFSFGGNKVRFAQKFLEGMREKGCDALITYGGPNSNLCRILTDLCANKGIPCAKVYNVDDDEEANAVSLNSKLIDGAGFKHYPCHKSTIADTVQAAIDDFKAEGRNPYYIYGNKFGAGNEAAPMLAYHEVYEEICRQEKAAGIRFDRIFLGSGTNATQSGLIAGMLASGESRYICGISTTRNAVRAKEVMQQNLQEYAQETGVEYKLPIEGAVHITDEYLAGGYGRNNKQILDTVRRMYLQHGIPLDGTYTGKAYYGMENELKKEGVTGENILFLHTGGAPLFMDLAAKGLFENNN